MKKFLFIMAAAATLFTACSKDEQNWIEHDYSNDILGTWTCLKAGFAEALVFKADGTFESVGVAGGEYWEYPDATWSLKNNKLTLSSGDYKSNVLLEIIPGKSLALVDAKGTRNIFERCENDLADEIVGMWVCNDGLTDGVTIMTYSNNGKSTITTAAALGTDDPLVKQESDYVVVGDLVFMKLPTANADSQPKYTVARMNYKPNGTSAGDIMIHENYIPSGDGLKESVMSFLRIKQNLDLANQKYDYIKTYVTNVSGEDKDIPFLNTSFNFAKMDGSIIDKFLKSTLFAVEFPNANTIKYSYLMDGQNIVIEAPIKVEGNKMTIKMSENGPYKDVEVYTFQDQDNTQMHMYMHTTSFEKFFANTSLAVMLGYGQLDKNDTEAIAEVYNTVADAVESINLSLVMSKSAK